MRDLYLAYGSNLHPLRLAQRVRSARLIGAVALPGFELKFTKRGRLDGTGKCMLGEKRGARAHGALYAIDPRHWPVLDRIEGRGRGYRREALRVEFEGRALECHTYAAQADWVDEALRPLDWYRDLVLAGARHLGFPARYVAAIGSHPVQRDADAARQARHARLLREMARDAQTGPS